MQTLVAIAAAWLAGLVLGRHLHLTSGDWLLLAAACVAAAVAFRRHPTLRVAFAGLLIAALGAARLQLAVAAPGPEDIAFYRDGGEPVTLIGRVVRDPEPGDVSVSLTLRVVSVRRADGGERQVGGLVLVRTSSDETYGYGDRVEATGLLETPPVFRDFSYRAVLELEGIRAWMADARVIRLAEGEGHPLLQALHALRHRAHRTLLALFPEPEASLLSGILLGLEGGIPPDVQAAFNATSTSHIIAISGFNITILASAVLAAFGRLLGRRRGIAAAALTIAAYTLLVGAAPSVVRAAVMAGLGLLALRLGRTNDALTSLAATAVAMTLAQPLALWDAGFQLSFAATLGLILYADPLQTWLQGRMEGLTAPATAARLSRAIGEFALFTLAAQVTTLPITAYHFQRLSLVGLLANPAILPAQPAVMILGGLATIAGTIWLPAGRVLAAGAWIFPAYTVRMVEFFAAWPLASIPLGRISLVFVAVYYAALAGVTFGLPALARRHRVPRLQHLPAGLGLAALALFTGMTWRAAADRPDGRLHITVLDVGGGDAVLVHTPSDRWLLIDGGPSPTTLAECLGRRLPFLHRRLDWVVLTGGAEDQVGGLIGITDRIPVAGALDPAIPGQASYRRWMDEILEAGVPVTRAGIGQVLDLGNGATARILGLDDRRMALQIEYGAFSFRMGGDTDADSLPTIPASWTMRLLADGGSEFANPTEDLSRQPAILTVISVDAGNRRGLPSDTVLAAVSPSTVLRTDQHGWIELVTDGRQIWTWSER